MTVVFLDPVGTLGGAERSLLDLAASMRRARPDIPLALVLGEDGPLRAEAAALGMKVVVVEMPNAARRVGDSQLGSRLAALRQAPTLFLGVVELARYAIALRAAIATLRPTIIHSNGMKMHVLAAFVSTNVPVVWHLRDFVGQRRLMAPLLRALATRADAVIAISKSVATDAARELKRDDVITIYNGIDIGAFDPEGHRMDLDAAASLPAVESAVRVGLVATYARWKGHELFLDAAAKVQRSHPLVRFYIIGGGAYSTEGSEISVGELRRMIEARKLSSAVGLVPFQSHPAAAFRSLDVVVHTSTKPEPFGRTIAEAMSCGRPVIVSNEGGAAELIEDGIDALAVRPRDATALANAIGLLASNQSERKRLGAAARETATQRFSNERLGLEVLKAYQRLGMYVVGR